MKIFLTFNLLIVLVIIIRSVADGKISRKMQYAMWLMLPIYVVLVMSVNIPVKVSEPDMRYSVSSSSAATMREHPGLIENHAIDVNNDRSVRNTESDHDATTVEVPYMAESAVIADTEVVIDQTFGIDSRTTLKMLYLIGVIVIGSAVVINNIVFARRTYRRRRYYARSASGNLKVYKLKGIKSPFLFGKNIYICEDMNEGTDIYSYSVCHEYCHYRQGDTFWPILKYAFVVLLWFDPLIWAAALLIERDSEMAVDERVIKMLGEDNKAAYSMTLLNLATRPGRNETMALATTSMSGKSRTFLRTRVINIMHGTRKSIATILAVTLALASVVGCSLVSKKTVCEASYVSADSLWYDSEQVIYGNEQAAVYGTNDIRMIPMMISPDMRIFRLSIPLDPDADTGAYEPEKIVSYTSDGDLIGTIDLEDGMDVSSIVMAEGVIKGIVGDYRTGEYSFCTLNFEEGTISDAREVLKGSRYSCDSYWQTVYRDGLLYIESAYLENSIYKSVLSVTDAEGNVINEYAVGSDLIRWTVNSDGDFLCTGPSQSADHMADYYIIDHDTGATTLLNLPLEVLQRYDGNTVLSGDYLYYLCSNYTIARYDPVNKEEAIVFDFNCSYTNFSELSMFDLKYCDEDNIIFTRNGRATGPYEEYYARDVISLSRCDSNPNAGKQIIRLAIVDYLNDEEGAAISGFNLTDPDYFIMVDPEYDAWNVYLDAAYGFESYDEAMAYVISELKISIDDGTGPDIVLNGGRFLSLEDDELFIDLNDLIDGDEGIDRSGYIDAGFRAMEQDGELYHLPLSMCVSGYLVDPDLISDDKTGFTFSEYRAFGEQYGFPEGYSYNADEDFDILFDWNIAYYTDGNDFSIDNEDFRDMVALAEAEAEGSISSEHLISANLYSFWHAMEDTLNLLDYSGWRFVGSPSADGSGPALYPASTVGVTTCASSEDGALRFIEYALSEQPQEECHHTFPINISAFRSLGQRWVDYENDPANNAAGRSRGFTYDYLDMLLEWLGQTDRMILEEPKISLIVDEEMPAYWSNQKILDDVIDIIENRVNLMLEEN